MRIAFVVCDWSIVSIVLVGLHALGRHTLIVAPIAVLVLTSGDSLDASQVLW
ncbi:hypothetical protein RRSWK_04708 [Rhodopirellula sp. SWK7]|nr:hypothetical protein RRSWK_04708 [Rhodopirellula sp. SWK7]